MTNLELVRCSFERSDKSGEFSNTFYEIFMSKSDDIKSFFKDTDFTKQKKLLRATVKILATKDIEDQKTKKLLEDIARTHNHSGYDIAPHYYRLWLDSLCETLSRLDPEYSEELESVWRKLMQISIDFIVARYDA